ncbi:hypothetical protein ACFQLX_21140 [Streptomyces polyrhachis]|uniref:Lipoprotein n=1 Tax=Streptomyces polyrhachis TaxID=1282885 RepID=A0ABW2GIM5_9ACTN
MRIRTATVGLVLTSVALAGCSAAAHDAGTAGGHRASAPAADAHPERDTARIPGIGAALRARIPADSRQVVAVYGRGRDSADSLAALYTRRGDRWHREASWPAHNGRRGWTPDHHEGDKRSPIGVFTLSDAGGVLPAPGVRLPYTRSAAFTAPSYWKPNYRHDFDLVIAIDYNRLTGTSPLDPTRPRGGSKGGGIWLHLDHGSGTSACVSLPKEGMRTLLRTLDPDRHPVIVMGDRAALAQDGPQGSPQD